MWWLIAWVILSLLAWGAFLMLAGSVPSTERATNADALKLGAIAFVAWAIALLVIFGIVSALQGIF